MRIGIDTGGTFTDVVVFEGGEIRALKVFSTPEDPARGILDGALRAVGSEARNLSIVHGTTIGTNSLLERRGARVALVTTAGFEDLIEIGRQNRPRLYDFNVRRELPLVPGALRLGVRERTSSSGQILEKPSQREVERLMHRIRRAGAESVALCLLFSFANPMNERRMARALERLGIPISVSHEILPEFREYERLSTVVINAFLAPRVGQYLTSLERLAARQFSKGVTRVFIMQSSGGITTAARAAREPVRTILSGPAGGVVAAEWLAGQMGLPRAISFDMGGTSTDVCLIEGVPRTTRETTVGGLPVAVPVLDVHSVGAGGGSIARFDRGGALRVGPESAGSLPGPACYGRGGRLPTVTDAHVTLGRLHPAHFLGGSYTLSRDAAEQAFAKLLRHSHARFKSKLELAQGVVAVANANMERALRVISVERGHDPRDFSLIAFGGAGGLHAADLARALGLARVIVPRHPGAFSALGILTSDIVKDVSRSVLRAVPDSRREMPAFLHELEAGYRQLESAARAELRQEQSGTARPAVTRTLDVRYHGQAYELTLPFAADFAAQFHRDHERAYGYAHAGRALEVVSLRVRLTLPTPKPPRLRPRQAGRRQLSDAVVAVQPVWFESRAWETPFFNREKLGPGMRFQGPAVILEYSSTTVVPPDFLCVVDGRRNLVLQKVPDS